MEDFREIEVRDARVLHATGEAVFLDIRDPGSFEAGHIEGAQHLSDANIASVLESLAPDEPLVVYCYHGNSSRGGAAFFSSQGFREVYSLRGGYEAWRRSTLDET